MAFFCSLACAGWAWFQPGANRGDGFISFEPRRHIEGYAFEETLLGEQVAQTLATTNLLNGTYFKTSGHANGPRNQSNGEGIRAFAAAWLPNGNHTLDGLQHTPDICWVGVGWKPVDSGQPRQIILSLPIGGTKTGSSVGKTIELPFECRVFQRSPQSPRELVIWCTLLAGQLLPEEDKFSLSMEELVEGTNPRALQAAAGRKVSVNRFLQAIRTRTPGNSSKQFIRCSVGFSGSWQSALEELRLFAFDWIEVRPSRRQEMT